MSSDLFMFDECLYQQHSGLMNSEETQFLSESDPFSAPSDSSIDSILQEFSEPPTTNTITGPQNSTIPEKFDPNPLYQRTRFSNSSDFSGGYVDCPVSAIKTEDPPLRLDSRDFFLGSRSYGGVEENGTMRLSQRSCIHGSHSYVGEKPWFLFQPRFFDSLFESSAFVCSHENGFSNNPQMRRVCSTGDLPGMGKNQTNVEYESNATTINLMQEANLKVGRYNAEERKERIDRYKAKRTQRNFNKTIKYACRKTLADNRARVRGRFARNDEPVDMPKSAPFSCRYDRDDDILLYGWYEEEDLGIASSGGSGDTGGSAGGCCGGGRRGQTMNYEFGDPSEIHHYFGY